ncbi:MAG: hypothetical protein CVV50_01405 [Spirochaetae bacterium HGW-Spirochaetae-6]|nr:MAG: hypothetical protein CVV50_01405 [Spirochaetae bacterium HGW-Spirochaetae-6]
MKVSSENKKLLWLTGIFVLAYFIPMEARVVKNALNESFAMLSEYAHDHVLLCLVPAFFIAGAIQIFIHQQAVIAYLGPSAKKWVAYSVSAVSGTILAVCSCTVLPLFKGIYRRGAGLGPAVAFLYSGPAINVLAIILTAKVLGMEIGVARAIMAIVFSVVIGLLMHLIFRKADAKRLEDMGMFSHVEEPGARKLWQNSFFMASMIGILVFVNWAPSGGQAGFYDLVFAYKYWITGFFGVLLLFSLFRWFKKSELKDWTLATRDFALQILPLLFLGVLVAGFLLGRPGHPALIPESWVASLVGDNSILSNLFASVSGALMYFATLTEIPIMQGLIGAGMAKGPALALLLAGPSLSLPSILVIKGELGWTKTLTYAGLVVALSTVVGVLYGHLF